MPRNGKATITQYIDAVTSVYGMGVDLATFLATYGAVVAHGAKGNSYNFMVVFFAALGSFTYGFSSSIIGTVFGLQPFFDYFNLSLTGPNAKHGNDIIGGNHPERHV